MLGLKLLLAKLINVSFGLWHRPEDTKTGVCFVISENNKGWILDAIAKEIVNAQVSKTGLHIHYGIRNIPNYDNIIFMHYGLLLPALIFNPKLFNVNKVVFFTHFDFSRSKLSVIYNLRYADTVICMNSYSVEVLRSIGIKSRLHYSIGAADEKVYTKHIRKQAGKVLICTAYYERKNPEKIHQIVSQAADLEFILLGRNWENYEHYDDLKKLKNLEILSLPYSRYKEVYARCTVFLSLSTLEGGPIPLIETMMANVFPVVTRVGFCSDIICQGYNGFLIQEGVSAEEIIELVHKAYEMEVDVSATVQNLNWQAYSAEFMKYVRGV